VVTFSRSGFLGFAAMVGFLLFRAAPRRPGTTVAAALALAGLLLLAAPGGYGDRLASIVDPSADETGSSAQRLELLKRAVVVASRHVVIGVGMGNYHVYSINEKRAHNSYLEISAELGVAGLLAYLVLMAWPLLGLRRVQRHLRAEAGGAPREGLPRELYILSIALQAAFLAYIVCSFFGSIQYLWYLYYLVAYAVALRRIHAAAFAPVAEASTDESQGALWPARVARATGRLWSAA
jgi:O-antigen ligase